MTVEVFVMMVSLSGNFTPCGGDHHVDFHSAPTEQECVDWYNANHAETPNLAYRIDRVTIPNVIPVEPTDAV